MKNIIFQYSHHFQDFSINYPYLIFIRIILGIIICPIVHFFQNIIFQVFPSFYRFGVFVSISYLMVRGFDT